MNLLVSREFLLSFISLGIIIVFIMFMIEGTSDWTSSKVFKRTFIGVALFFTVFLGLVSLNSQEEVFYATDWKQVYQNDKAIDVELSFDSDGDYKIPLNESLNKTRGYSQGSDFDPTKRTHYITLQKDGVKVTRKVKLVGLIGALTPTSKIIKVEYRKIDYTQNKLFGLVGSKEHSEYDGELRLTLIDDNTKERNTEGLSSLLGE